MFDFVFIVLVYRNTDDLENFFNSLCVSNSKVLVVNSFYDETTNITFRQISMRNNADYITVPNKGYGAGNNAGVKFALENYNFKYLIISNADVVVEKMDIEVLNNLDCAIFAPKILNLRGRNQNPSSPFYPGRFYSAVKAWVFKGNHTFLVWGIYMYSRLSKLLFYMLSLNRRKIFSAHGAFVIIPQSIVKQLAPLYNEDMFLFNEEEYLGLRAYEKGVSTIYVPDIVISHKEDGSMKIANINEFERMRDSYLIFYDYYKTNLNRHDTYK